MNLNDAQVGQLASTIFDSLAAVGWSEGKRRAAIANGIRAWDESVTLARQRAEDALEGVSWAITYLGETLDVLPTEAEARDTRRRLITDIFLNKVPDFLTGDDFEDLTDAYDQIRITTIRKRLIDAQTWTGR